jgi:hypothetical protein
LKKIIIVSPHFPPSNLAAVHRTRLFAKHLPSLGWEPIIVTVDHKYYEENLDWNLSELVPPGLRVERVKAVPVKPVKIIGDIGVRGFYFLYQRILKIIKEEKVHFLYIPIPSNFASLLGTMVFRKTGVPYGIDYIDPWVITWPGTEKRFSRHWWSMKLGEWLEPIAVKHASLITGVAPGYYEDVLKRNPNLSRIVTAAMPYGAEKEDHEFIHHKSISPYLFSKQEGVLDIVYAGAMLPRAFGPLNEFLQAISTNKPYFKNVRFHFIGTGTSPNDPNGYNIKPAAEKYGLWQNIIFEYPKRIPYLDVLTHLAASDGIFILGSTEAHYTPSKVYQAVLSGKPILAILHEKSSAGEVIEKSRAGICLKFNGEQEVPKIGKEFLMNWLSYTHFIETFDAGNIDRSEFERYSAFNITQILSDALEKAIENDRK